MKPIWIFLGLLSYLSPTPVSAQQDQARPDLTLQTLRQKDLSTLWIGALPLIDKLDSEPISWWERPEPLGYIGNNFQRFYIHITEVGRSASDSLMYNLKGFTRTGETICPFEGELLIDSLLQYPPSDAPDFSQGIWSGWYLKGRYRLREDPHYARSGILEGAHQMSIAADADGNIFYDTLYLVADGYANNEWEGTWRSYRTGIVKICNWGDFRIPNSRKLDVGCAEFIPNEAYLDNGWQSYADYYRWSPDEQFRKAAANELLRWWLAELR